MKKKRIVIVCVVAVVLIFCLWYTRPRTVEQFCPVVELGNCTEIHLSGFMESGDMSEYEIKSVQLRPEDEEFVEIIEMLENRRFSVRLANLLPQGTKTHRTENGDFKWRMYFYFEDVELLGTTGSGSMFGFENFYGEVELSCIGESHETWRVTTKGKDTWLREIYDLVK